MSDLFKNELEKVCLVCKNPNKEIHSNIFMEFHKAHDFFSKSEIDSSYIYATKLLENKSFKKKDINFILYVLKGRVLTEKALYNAAEGILQEAIIIGEDINNVYTTNLYAILGRIHVEQKEFNKAVKILENWKKSYNNENTENSRINVHNLGVSYLHLQNFNKAEINLKESFNFNEEAKDTLGLARSCLDLANLYYVQYKDAIALRYFEKGLAFAEKTTNLPLLQNAYLNLAIVEENNKNYGKSLNYRKGFEKIKDSIWNKDQVWKLAEKDKEITLAVKDKEIKTLELSSELQKERLQTAQLRNIIYSSIAIFFLIIIILSVFTNFKIRKKNRIISIQKDELVELVETNDRLFSIITHDLKSPIGLLKNKLMRAIEMLKPVSIDKEEATQLILDSFQLSKRTHLLIDNTLHWVIGNKQELLFSKEKLPVESIINMVHFDYIFQLEEKEIKFKNEVDSSFFVEADLNSLKIIFRNILDNAIKFSHPKSEMLVSSNCDESTCTIHWKDQGIGFDQNTENEDSHKVNQTNKDVSGNIGTGLGLRLCKVLAKKNEGSFEIKSIKGKGTTVSVTLNKYKIA
ncbi:tetratricopeptide repeat-containing sensor histidine kinase [Lutibacter flavus]|uniref:tetratricopeptide repeat-containing sensor histidine kinase n=1 Tax=Lutibacter flavus TaxID=691689 RepID=UPI001595D565|nr:tetratricopeptide repeat-containing sensor histidine kinase [Lutibacter flavus]